MKSWKSIGLLDTFLSMRLWYFRCFFGVFGIFSVSAICQILQLWHLLQLPERQSCTQKPSDENDGKLSIFFLVFLKISAKKRGEWLCCYLTKRVFWWISNDFNSVWSSFPPEHFKAFKSTMDKNLTIHFSVWGHDLVFNIHPLLSNQWPILVQPLFWEQTLTLHMN